MDPILERLAETLAADGATAYVVGGAVRDRLAGRATRDLDISVSGPVLEISPKLASALNATHVVFDEERGHVRLVPRGRRGGPVEDRIRWIDVTSHGGDLEADLARRDFSVNAMAVPLAKWVAGAVSQACIDPFGGADDLRRKVVRETRPGNTLADPIRLLRAPRLAARLGLTIDPATAAVIAGNASLLRSVAGERVRDELFDLIGGERAMPGVMQLDELGLLEVVIPELTRGRDVTQPKEHAYDVMTHQLHALDAAERILDPAARDTDPILQRVPWRPELDGYFGEVVADDRTRAMLLKLAALLHDIGKPGARSVQPDGRTRFFGHERLGAEMAGALLRRLRCSRRVIAHVSLMLQEHLRPSQLSAPGESPTDRAIHRYFRDVSPVAVDTIFLNLADYMAARGHMLAQPEWATYAGRAGDILSSGLEPRRSPPKPGLLLNGHQVQERFGLSPGPEIGRLLAALREAEATGAVRTRAEAYELLARLQGRAASRRGST